MSKIEIGKYTYGTETIQVFSYGEESKLRFGAFCSVALGVKAYLSDGVGHRANWMSVYPFGSIHQDTFACPMDTPATKGDITVGNDVWIGGGVTLMHGITVGDGVVIANNSHVVKDVPPYAIVGGNPAKEIRYRFSEEIIAALLDLKWWDFQDEIIRNIVHFLHADPTIEMIGQIKNYALTGDTRYLGDMSPANGSGYLPRSMQHAAESFIRSVPVHV
jgi:acetyltransferase-like isoleucine patch superfamily enzyme